MNIRRFPCYSSKTLTKDRIIVPQSLISDSTLLIFSLQYNGKKICCGTKDFTHTNSIYVPNWVMEYLKITDGTPILIESTKLSKATFVNFTVSKSFLQLSNPKVILEYYLRDYMVLNLHQTITIDYLNKKYTIKVAKLEPKDYVCINEADVNFILSPIKEKKYIRNKKDYWSKLGSGYTINRTKIQKI